MEISRLITTYAESKLLRKAKITKKTVFVYDSINKTVHFRKDMPYTPRYISAYTLQELLEVIPFLINNDIGEVVIQHYIKTLTNKLQKLYDRK